MKIISQIRQVVAAIQLEYKDKTAKKQEGKERAGTGKILFLVTLGSIGALALMGPAVVVIAGILAIFTLIAIATLFIKIPTYVRRIMVKHDLATDAALTVGTYVILGGTLTALIAAGMVGALISSILMIIKGVAEEEGIL